MVCPLVLRYLCNQIFLQLILHLCMFQSERNAYDERANFIYKDHFLIIINEYQ